MTVLPLAFWVPCRSGSQSLQKEKNNRVIVGFCWRIPAEELFPVRSWPLGPGTVPRPPAPGCKFWEKTQTTDPDDSLDNNDNIQSI